MTEVLLVPATVHGRVLVRKPDGAQPRGLLVGFHGYAETAAVQLERLAAIPGAAAWTLVAIQGLNRFYRGRSRETIAGWMTREDRVQAIADNVAYVDEVLATVRRNCGQGDSSPLICAGFSQGVAMAFRTAVRGRHAGDAVIAVGGDVPPELLDDASVRFPRTLLVRGERDEWYTQARHDADVGALRSRSAHVAGVVVDAAHEWTDAVASAAAPVLASLQAP